MVLQPKEGLKMDQVKPSGLWVWILLGLVILGALGLAAFCRASTLHNCSLRGWASPARSNTFSGTGIILQNPASELYCVCENVSHNFCSFCLIPLPFSSIYRTIPTHAHGLTLHLMQRNYKLLQKWFPASHLCAATGRSCSPMTF